MKPAAAADAAGTRARRMGRRRHRGGGHRRNFPTANVRESLQRVTGNLMGKGLNSAQVVQRYAAGTVLQAGPGIPAWRYNSYSYYWSGPVKSDDTVRFIYVGPAGAVLLAPDRRRGAGGVVRLAGDV